MTDFIDKLDNEQTEKEKAEKEADPAYKSQMLLDQIQKALEITEIRNTYNKYPYCEIDIQKAFLENTTSENIYREIETNPEETKILITRATHFLCKDGQTETMKPIVYTGIPKMPSFLTPINEIREQHLEKSIIIQGTIKRIGAIIYSITSRKYYCQLCDLSFTKKFTTEDTPPKTIKCPTKKCAGNMRYKDETTKPMQTIRIEEIQTGEDKKLESMDCTLTDTLTIPEFTKKIIIGNPITLIGKIEKEQIKDNRYTKIMLVHGIETLEDDTHKYNPTSEDIDYFHKLMETNPDLLTYWSEIVFEKIRGYSIIKQSIIAQMIGSYTLKKAGKTNRGVIHILIMGDPASAKSTFLTIVREYALKFRFSTGAGSSAVGLTAGIIKDENTGAYYLEAGVFPNAHLGIAGIDEIDKLSVEEQDKLHEPLEQMKATFDKANIHAELDCETSLLGVGNAKTGSFKGSDDLLSQLSFKDTFTNRCDFIHITIDHPDEKRDGEIAQVMIDNWKINEEEEKKVRENIIMFKKFQKYAKTFRPEMPIELETEMKQWYVELRKKMNGDIKSIKINARTLDAIVRLILAHARTNLRTEANRKDFEWATYIYEESLRPIATDNVSGNIDVNKLETGLGQSEKKTIDLIYELIQTNPFITTEELKTLLNRDITHRQLEAMLDRLKKGSLVFEPHNNKWHIIQG